MKTFSEKGQFPKFTLVSRSANVFNKWPDISLVITHSVIAKAALVLSYMSKYGRVPVKQAAARFGLWAVVSHPLLLVYLYLLDMGISKMGLSS